jgi:hypothetical protein
MSEIKYFRLDGVGETNYRVSEFSKGWRQQALVGVHMYDIERLKDKTVVSQGKNGEYRRTPFLFEAEGLRETVGGCHWIIPGGVATRAQLIVEPSYQLTTRVVQGRGWFLRWHPQRGINITYADTRLGLRNPVVTSGYQWLVCWVAHPEVNQIIVEGVDSPHYDPKFEREIMLRDQSIKATIKDFWGERTAFYPLGEFWYHLDRLSREERIDMPGR